MKQAQEIEYLRGEIDLLKCENNQLRHEKQVNAELWMQEVKQNQKFKEALLKNRCLLSKRAYEEISNPKYRDHQEPDEYTQSACLMHIAFEALSQ